MNDRPTKAAADLKPNVDHLWHRGEFGTYVTRVVHVHPYTDRAGVPCVTVLHDESDDDPMALRLPAHVLMPLATPDEVDAAADHRRRNRIADGLERLADVVRSAAVPFPLGPLDLVVPLRSYEAVQAVAKVLGVDVATAHGQSSADWRSHADDAYGERGSVTARWVTYRQADDGGAPTVVLPAVKAGAR